jgi:DNA replication protein DnaC
MLKHPTYDKLLAMKLTGMAAALDQQDQSHECRDMTFEERLGLLVDTEMIERTNRQIAIRLKIAKLRQDVSIEDIDYQHPRGLDRAQMMSLITCGWIKRRDNCVVTGPTGAGKTYLACALANKACRDGYTVTYERVPRLFAKLAIAHADGSFARKLTAIARYDLLVLDDWGLAPLTLDAARDLLEILEDRYGRRSTMVATQIPIGEWHKLIPDPTLADATMDRLVHNAHRLELTGESMRKVLSTVQSSTQSTS